MTDQHRLSGRASLLAFAATTAVATAAATGLFVLLDPRAQSYWSARWDAVVGFVRALFGGGG